MLNKSSRLWSFSVISFLLLAGLFAEVFGAAKLIASERQDIINAAKKEGEVVYYTGMNISDTNLLMNKFMEKYPFIRAKFLRASSNKLLIRILEELRGGKLPADVIQIGSVFTEVVKQRGGMGNYVSPELEALPDEFKDPKGLWGSAYITTNVLAYNTRLVKGSDIPKSYHDLLNPNWKGKKLGFTRNEVRWFIAQVGIMGEEKALQFMQKLAEQDLKISPDKPVTRTLLAAGDLAIDVNEHADQIERMKKAGAPVEWIGVSPVYASVLPVFVTKTAPHPNAAKLLVDFILSREGQTIMRSLGRIPTRRDVLPDPPRLIQGLKFYPDKAEAKSRFDEYNSMFNKIFLTKTK